MLRTTGDDNQGPLLVFLAACDIRKGTELTISYLDNGMLHIKLPGAPALSTPPATDHGDSNDDSDDDDDDGMSIGHYYCITLADQSLLACRCQSVRQRCASS
jgi:hypothetical protein